MIIAVTGHREVKDQRMLWANIEKTFAESKPERVIIGMADGTDLMAGAIAVGMLIPITAAIPWRGHQTTIKAQDRYEMVLEHADDIVFINDGQGFPGKQVYFERNIYMVDHCTHVLAYYNGLPSGTSHCVKYAQSKGIPVRNVYGKKLSQAELHPLGLYGVK